MSDSKGSNQAHDPAPRRGEASATADASTQQPVQRQASAGTQYWQGVATAGQAAKSARPQADAVKPARQRGIRT